jgi:glucosamine--fructose-6-phosphate aminotransferase (isomerizing)
MTKLMEEIAQQPSALAAVRKYYASPGAIPTRALRKLAAHWPPVVVFTGMGASLFAAYPAQAFLTSLGIRAVVWETAELLHHHLKFLGPDTLLILISQSGETVEITRLLDSVDPGAGILGLVNVEASTLARRSRLMLPMMAGGQTRVSTKTYMCSVAVLMYLAFAIAGKQNRPLTNALVRLIEEQEAILDRQAEETSLNVEFFDHPTYAALMSRGPDLASAYEGALILKEVVRIGAEAISAAQFRHGPIEIVNPAHRYIIFARNSPDDVPPPSKGSAGERKTRKYLLNLAEDIRSHGGRVLLFSDRHVEAATNLRLVSVAPARLGLGTLVDTLHIQLLAHELALRAGLDPGKFWIAEGVTRSE